jgi:predicted restriction endonuclease
MKLEDLEIESGEGFTRAELDERFDRGMTGRGIEICYDEEDQRYLRLFSHEGGPYSDDVRAGQFTYIGEGQQGDQKRQYGNKALIESLKAPLPICFFYKSEDADRWEYRGLVEVVDYDYGYLPEEGRKVYQFTLQRIEQGTEKADTDEAPPDLARPRRAETTQSRIIRNTVVVEDLKQTYEYTCQVCGDRRHGEDGAFYAEGHHLKPLGSPHEGLDVRENLLVLCPNHHADFDYGNITVDPDSLEIQHEYDESVNERLTLVGGHELGREYLEYHNREIAES